MIDKILSNLQAEADFFSGTPMGTLQKMYYCKGVEKAISIVQEVAKEYGKDTNVPSNGWIPVETELPNITNDYLVTKMCENDGNHIYETAHEIFWTIDGKWDCERDEFCDWKVIAWQNKIAPYQKGE